MIGHFISIWMNFVGGNGTGTPTNFGPTHQYTYFIYGF